MGGKPVPHIPEALDKIRDNIPVVNGRDVLNKEVLSPLILLNIVPYAFVEVELFVLLELVLGLVAVVGQQLGDGPQQGD